MKKIAAEVVKETVKKTPNDKAPAKKAATKKAPAKKEPVKKATEKANKIKTSFFIQFNGMEIEEQDIISKVKEVWVSELGKKVKDIKTLCTYVKPEEQAVYYVINDTETGRIEL